ncbi:MAG: leucine-rich repeat protein [Lachnospiraceae bacterium]|nr:leucine-rich repeat protein [Lachnospiraceae bacterium]
MKREKRNVIRGFLCILLMFTFMMFAQNVKAEKVPTEEEAYNAIMSLQSSFPEGMKWTNDNYYKWKGGIYTGGYGCAGFAFRCSDEAFGNLPAREVTNITIKDVHVGDILRINGNTHSVVVVEVFEDYVKLCEGNFNSSIHWGRTMSSEEVAASTYMITRYPEGIFASGHMHQYQVQNATADNNIAYKECSICHEKKAMTTMDGFKVWWWTGINGSSAVSEEMKEGTSMSVSLKDIYPGNADDTEISLSSSDTSVMTTDGKYFTFVGTGEVTLTIYATHRPSVYITQKFKVNHCYDGDVSIIPATCEQSGLMTGNCKYCGPVKEVIPTTGHVYGGYIKPIAATTNSEGRKGYYVCLNCSQKFLDSGLTQAVKDEDLIIPVIKPTETPKPSETPSAKPSETPSAKPSETPSETPSAKPSETPSAKPSETPSAKPSETPSETPSAKPSETPSAKPSETPSAKPSETPSAKPSETPSAKPSETPSAKPSETPSTKPSSGNQSVFKDKKGSTYVIISSNKKAVCFKSAKKNIKGTVIVLSKVKISGKNYNVTEISKNAFKDNKKVTKIVLPAGIKKIGANAFSGCEKLKVIEIKSKYLTTKTLDAKAFKGIKRGTVIKVPKSKLKEYKKLFIKKGLSKKVKIK